MAPRQPGRGCLLLFLAPFFLVGIGAAVLAVLALIAGRLADAGFAAIFAIGFGGIASLFLFLGGRTVDRVPARAEPAPEPWLRRPEWAARRITSGGSLGAWILAAFALIWNSIAWTVTLLSLRQAGSDAGSERYFILLFPLIGLGLIVGAVVSTLRYLRYGVSVLELATLPAPPGRLLAGRLRTSARMEPAAGFHVVLSNVHRRITGSGKNRSTSTTVLWQQDWMVPGASAADGGTSIPLALPIPADARETDESDSTNAILWTLEVEAAVPGLDYQVSFEVPVFRTAESLTPLAPEELAAFDAGPSAGDSAQSATSRIVLRRQGRDLVLEFPPGSAMGPGLVMLGAVVVLGAVGGFVRMLDAPLFVLGILGVIGVVLLAGAARMLLVWSRVTLEAGRVTVRTGMAGGVELWHRVLDPAGIRAVRPATGVQVGTRVIWDLVAETTAGEMVVLGRGIHSGREAEWLSREVTQALRPEG